MTEKTKLGKPPCGSCTLCCTTDLIFLHTDAGDDPSKYETAWARNPFTGEAQQVIKPVETADGNIACRYLDPKSGCTIYNDRPLICRKFDCRGLYLRTSRAARRRSIKSGSVDPKVFNRGREIADTLNDEDAEELRVMSIQNKLNL